MISPLSALVPSTLFAQIRCFCTIGEVRPLLKSIFLSFLPGLFLFKGRVVSRELAVLATKSKRRNHFSAFAVFAWCSASILVLACRPAMAAVTRDVSASLDQNTAAKTVTTPAFTTKSGQELLLAF